MHILYDNIIYSLQRAGGISNYWMELTQRAIGAGHDVRMLELLGASGNIFRAAASYEKAAIDTRLRVTAVDRYLPLRLPDGPGPSIFHSSYYRVPVSKKDYRTVVTLHDFIYEHHVTGIRKSVHSIQKRMSIKNADGIICISENTRQDLLKFYPECSQKNIRVIHNGISEVYCVLPQEHAQELDELYEKGNTRPFALFVGDRSRYKNFDFAVKVMERQPSVLFVIVGGGSLSKTEHALLSRRLPRRFIQLKGISSEQLNVLYNFAQYLLYPSSYEGFGLPLVEAMKAGCPVIAFNRSSIGELAKGYGLLLDELSIDAAVGKIRQAVARRPTFAEHGFEIAKRYSWARCAEETFDFYRSILEN